MIDISSKFIWLLSNEDNDIRFINLSFLLRTKSVMHYVNLFIYLFTYIGT
jgi:hypothetical protein